MELAKNEWKQLLKTQWLKVRSQNCRTEKNNIWNAKFTGLNSELEMAQERFCELEVRSIAIIQCEELREENGGGVRGEQTESQWPLE